VLYDAGFAPQPDEGLRVAAKQLLDETLERVVGPEPGVVVEGVLVPEPAGESLVALAGAEDVLVVGATGRSAISRLLMGSVANHCARHAHCPVVIVPGP
jgi:nucleotide-binding universal stress UspA family protein